MNDITISWDSAISYGDWILSGGALLTGEDLASAILVSLFSDAMADPDDVIPDGTGDPRGWWGDQFDVSTPTGSKLWLLDRSKQTQETLGKAYDYVAAALQWLIDDSVVSRFDIQMQWVRKSFLGAHVVAYAPDGSTLHSGAYLWAWNGTN